MRFLTSPRETPVAEVWRTAMIAVSSEDQLLHVARRYLESWTPDELTQLPVTCRPKRLQRANDVSLLVFKLQNAYELSGGLAPERRGAVERMLAFMETLMQRLLCVRDSLGAAQRRP